ncbi:MAG: hypothetical protein N5P05_003701 [Chroococcopsis gigantea SAG 12.99]|jgi:hypothetical protein|nr:hypothetical protein [Chroococcopsis gigantea SAG 12.99]
MEEVLIIGGIGVGALLILAPIVGFINPQVGQAMSDSGRNLLKDGLKIGMDAYEKVEASVAEAGQSWEDLVAEVKSEKATNNAKDPHRIEISGDNS